MIRGWCLLAAAVLVLAPAGDRTVITAEGKIHSGTVTREGATVLVSGPSGTLRIPAGKVVAVFSNAPEARAIATGRLEEAKKLFEEAGAMPERDPLRRHKLSVSLEICKETRDLIEILERGSLAGERGALAGVMRQLPQLMRLLRDAMGSSGVGEETAPGGAGRVPFERLGSEPRVSDPPPRTGEVTVDLGSGQVAAVRNLGAKELAARLAAARSLISPPAPHARAALCAAMSTETNPEALAAIVEALVRLDLEPTMKSDLAWALQERDWPRLQAVLQLLRRIGTRPACDFVMECFKESPPFDHKGRAAYASAFRRMRPGSLEELRNTLLKTKERQVQVEAVRQLGVLRDRAAAPMLKVAMTAAATGALPRELLGPCVFALETLGKPAFPVLLEAMNDGNDDVRRNARALVQRISGEPLDGVSEASKWWQRNRKSVEEDELKFWKDQEARDYPVAPDEFRIFDRKFTDSRN